MANPVSGRQDPPTTSNRVLLWVAGAIVLALVILAVARSNRSTENRPTGAEGVPARP